MMDGSALEKRLAFALDVAGKASDFLFEHAAMRSEITVKAENDFVTSADRKCEELISSLIASAFPEDGYYGEESGRRGDSTCLWIVDPIDGTVDFMHGFPCYTVSISFYDEEGPAVGVVAVPAQREVFWAMRGKGAYLNGERISTFEGPGYSRTLAVLVPPHRHHEILDDYMVKMRRFYSVFSDMRSMGSAALSLCYVACGRCACYYEYSLQKYDYAAGILIVREAGGRAEATERDDGTGWDIAASGSAIWDKVMELTK